MLRSKQSNFVKILFFSVPFALLMGGGATASENINTNVSIEPSLTVTIPSTPLVLNLDPSSTTSGSNDLTITVGTNNATGYKTIMTSSSGNTDLVETTDNTLTIPTLASGSYTSPSDFPANHWGYKKDSGSYIPFATNTTILESDTYANDDTTTLSFATKIDYLQASGTYKTTLVFTTTVNPLVTYIQDFTATMCQEKASSADYTVVDKRDGQEYTVRYINGSCWMTRNLAIGCDGVGSTYGTNIISRNLTTTDSNVASDKSTAVNTLAGGGIDLINQRMQCSSTYGAWYNYAAATAGTIYGSSNNANASEDICPYGWRLPTADEQSSVSNYSNLYSPVSGGIYYNGSPYGGYAAWWSSLTASSARRYHLVWVNSALEVYGSGTYIDSRGDGAYVRCVAK